MGVYDIYGVLEVQLKVGDVGLEHFKVGDKVYIPDGIYFGREEAAIVIKDGIFVAEFPRIMDKFGHEIDINHYR